jgi:Lon protease-like protein
VVQEVQRAPDGRYGLLTLGGHRFRLLDIDRSRAYLQADLQLLGEPAGGDQTDQWATKARAALAAYAEVRGATVGALPAEPTALSYAVAAALAVDLPERQALLAAPDTTARLATEVALLTRETAVTRKLGAVPLAAPLVPRSSLN